MIIRGELPADAETLRKLFSQVYSNTMFDSLQGRWLGIHDGRWLPGMSHFASGFSDLFQGKTAASRQPSDALRSRPSRWSATCWQAMSPPW